MWTIYLKDGLVDYRCILVIGPASGSSNSSGRNSSTTTCIIINGVRRAGLHGAISTGRLSGSMEVCKRKKNRGRSEAYLGWLSKRGAMMPVELSWWGLWTVPAQGRPGDRK